MMTKRFYTYAEESIELIRAMRARFDSEIRRIRDISRFRPDDTSSVTPDS